MNKSYTNGEVTIEWKPSLCIHSGICAQGLPEVFRPKERPWVNPAAATTQAIIDQVNKCPSGALSYFMNNDVNKSVESNDAIRVETIPNGPLMVYGALEIKNDAGEIEHKSKATAFCRCGASNNKPFCDGTHKKTGFTSSM